MKLYKFLPLVCHLLVTFAAFAVSTSSAESKKLNLKLIPKSKIEFSDFSSSKQEKGPENSKLGTTSIEDYFDEVDSHRALEEINAFEPDDSERESISRRYIRNLVGKQVRALLKESDLRQYYLETQKLADKSKNAVKYDPARMKPEDVAVEVPITFGIDLSRGIAPTLRAGEHVQLTLNPFINRIMLDTEWRF